MDSERLAELVLRQIEGYRYDPPPGLIGNALPPEEVRRYIERLRQALVRPYLQRFELRETAEQIGREHPEYAEYWVVAEGGGDYVEWYDPERGEFGLAVRGGSGVPVSIGVRGDVVGAFIAM
jgi:hypothetical protein